MERKFNFIKSFKNDYALGFWLILAISFFGAAVFYFMKNQPNIMAYAGFSVTNLLKFLLILVVIAILSLFAMKLRIDYIKSFIDNGIIAKGTITSTFYFRGRRRIKIKYTFNGVEYEKAVECFSNGTTRAFSEGSEVEILVNSEDNKKILIPSLCFD